MPINAPLAPVGQYPPDPAAEVRLVARRLGVTEEAAAASMELLKAAVVTVGGKPAGSIIDYLRDAKDERIEDLGDRIFGRRLFPPKSTNLGPR